MTQREGRTLFNRRLAALVRASADGLKPEDLAKFALAPNPLLENRSPWEMLTDSDDSEFERVLVILRGMAAESEGHACLPCSKSSPSEHTGDPT